MSYLERYVVQYVNETSLSELTCLLMAAILSNEIKVSDPEKTLSLLVEFASNVIE